MSSEAGTTADEMAGEPASGHSRVRMHPERARYGMAAAAAVLDAGTVAHVGVLRDGAPMVLPMAYGRDGGTVYLHGGGASSLMASIGAGQLVCVTVTILDGLVLARSAFKHSMNYRSVVVRGPGRTVTTEDEFQHALRVVTDHNLPGRWDSLRPPTRKELAATRVVAVPLHDCTVKVREGGPIEQPEDVDAPGWAGVIPLRLRAGSPQPTGNPAEEEPALRDDLA